MALFTDVSNWLLGQYRVRTTPTAASGVIQHVRLDIGSGETESQVVGSLPVSVADSIPVTSDDLRQIIAMQTKSIQYPPNYDPALNRERATAIIESGTVTAVTTVSTVTTVTGLTNIDSYQGKLALLGDDMAAWALACRARIS